MGEADIEVVRWGWGGGFIDAGDGRTDTQDIHRVSKKELFFRNSDKYRLENQHEHAICDLSTVEVYTAGRMIVGCLLNGAHVVRLRSSSTRCLLFLSDPIQSRRLLPHRNCEIHWRSHSAMYRSVHSRSRVLKTWFTCSMPQTK